MDGLDRLTLIAPEVVVAILDGTQGPEVMSARVLEPSPVESDEQFPHFIAA
ncbi:hypothetical protein [Maritimibacter sp. 55A14]|uniref:hypothetical protein n=1 Tax=Maritimibacter sp. 55A14 TaxID=2174844 RepID=UPI001304F3E1|nr:hypothetical protein [Maritimibacter sp. 55A14]